MPQDNSINVAETALSDILRDASGFELSELDRLATFLELGFDSLFLIQFTQKIKSRLKVKLTFRQLVEEIPTLDALIHYLSRSVAPESQAATTAPDGPVGLASDSTWADEKSRAVAAQFVKTESASLVLGPPTADASAETASFEGEEGHKASHISLLSPHEKIADLASIGDLASFAVNRSGYNLPPRILPSESTAEIANLPSNAGRVSGLEQIITQQNQLMSMQLQILGQLRSGHAAANAVQAASVPGGQRAVSVDLQRSVAANKPQSATFAKAQTASLQSTTATLDTAELARASGQQPVSKEHVGTGLIKSKFERFGPYKPVRKSPSGGLTEKQQSSLDSFIQRFSQQTSRSREHAQKHRSHFADPRGVAGYRRVWKSIVYQICVDRSSGSKLWDIDGNEYIDVAMGFGLNLFGQSPEFVTRALHEQLDRGVEVGPQSPLAGEVAALLCDFSRKDRVTFCNTGSEAVMAAMRLARTVTGKSKVVFFNKDYHGNFEEVLLRSNQVGNTRRTQPAAPGVPQSFADNAIVLDYGTPEALAAIREYSDDIAAVLVEPVQSADPFNQPREFLHQIRQITRDNDIALIMDEVITGFRAAQGGAQEWFDVWGDMATYGKVLGGGLPIGALAGSNRFMDALDGGMWRYEDDTEPTADMTFFAGTFVRHPLALTAAYQIMMKVKEEGPELQERLTRKTTLMVNELNEFFTEESFPFRVAQFTSLFRFMFPADLEYADLLYFHLLDRGIFTRGWGDNCFLSTEHSDEDIQRIVQAVKSSCLEIRKGGFMPRADGPDLQSALSATSAEPSSTTSYSKLEEPAKSELAIASVRSSHLSPSRISTLEEIQEDGNLPPLFCMPAADGLSLVYHDLASELGPDQPVYGLTSPGVYGEELPLTIEEMAQRFVADIREFRPHGPYLLMGYCSGGTIAFEVAQQLLAAGEKVALVAGVETYDWGTAQSSRPTPMIKLYYNIQRCEFLLRNFLLLSIKDKWGFLQSKMDRIRSRTKNWRGMVAGWFSKQKAVSASGSVNMHELWRLHDAQADRYRPRILPGKLLLIRPRKDYRSYVGKQDLQASEGVKIIRLPAFPAGLLSQPYVKELAKIVRDSIQDGLTLCETPTRITTAEPKSELTGTTKQESVQPVLSRLMAATHS